MILNGNHTTISKHHDRETVLVFPEYRIVFGVESTPKGAELLYEKVVSPSAIHIPTISEEKEAGEVPFGILPIPYSCVILLCEFNQLLFFPRIFTFTRKAPTSDVTNVVILPRLSSNMVSSLL